jgi:hypothetical protein
VIITDSWNMKPLLAEAVRGYPYFLLRTSLGEAEAVLALNPVIAAMLLHDRQATGTTRGEESRNLTAKDAKSAKKVNRTNNEFVLLVKSGNVNPFQTSSTCFQSYCLSWRSWRLWRLIFRGPEPSFGQAGC